MADPIRDFKLDDDGDLDVTGGALSTVAGQDAVRQGCGVRPRMFLGECYLDESIGIDYLGVVLVKNPDELAVRAILSERLASVPDVTDVFGAQLTVDAQTREAAITYQIDSVYSENPFSASIGLEGV
mgnify:CR=1 FL=1